MHFAKVIGNVVATQKVEDLKGIPLKVIIPWAPAKAGEGDGTGTPTGDPVVAVDSIGARPGDLVLWVAKREASLAITGAPLANNYPVDAAITGIVDDIG